MSVLVTVEGPHGSADLELDDARPVGELLPDLADALGEPGPAFLRTPDGAELHAQSTLAEAGILDGQRLNLVCAGTTIGAHAALPCYLALDTSDSMAGPALRAVNAELARLFQALRTDSRLVDACRLAVLTFDVEARVDVPLTPVAELGASPLLSATRPATNYEALFRLLRRQITRDLDGLRMAGRRALRPAVFLLTDGHPTRGYWPPAHAALTDPTWLGAPDVVTFGFGDAGESAVRRMGTAGAYLPASAPGVPSAGPAGMLAAFMGFLLAAVGRPVTGLAIPERSPSGWRSLRERQP